MVFFFRLKMRVIPLRLYRYVRSLDMRSHIRWLKRTHKHTCTYLIMNDQLRVQMVSFMDTTLAYIYINMCVIYTGRRAICQRVRNSHTTRGDAMEMRVVNITFDDSAWSTETQAHRPQSRRLEGLCGRHMRQCLRGMPSYRASSHTHRCRPSGLSFKWLWVRW